jgi:hypothetical protein
VRLSLLILPLALCAVAPFRLAHAGNESIHRVSMTLGQYAQLKRTRADGQLQLHVPLAVVASDPEHAVSLTAGTGKRAPDVSQLLHTVESDLQSKGGLASDHARILAAAVGPDGTAFQPSALGYPAIILIRLQTNPHTPSGQELVALRDEEWEKAIIDWRATRGEQAPSLVVLSLITDR